MKRCLSFLILAVTLVLFAGCQSTLTDRPNTEASNSKDNVGTTGQSPFTQTVEIVEIIDIAIRDSIPCDDALQQFYADDEYNYFYPCIKSEYVVVKYSDNTEETVENALKNGKITISDLDRFEIKYIAYIREKK